MSLNFTGIEVKTINSLESWSGGVLVVVSGSVRAKDFSGRRKFVQTFMLAPQEKGYFVLNDIFHFIDEDVVHQHSVPVYSENIIEPQLPNSTPLPEPPVSDYSLEVDASEYVNSIHIDGDDPVDEYSLEERQQQQQQGPETDTELEETPVEESSDLLQNVVEAVPDPLYSVEEPLAEPPKLTYASILLVAKGQPVPSSVTSVASRPYVTPTPPASEWHHAQPAQQQSNVLESSLEATEENPSLEEEGELKSVYVRNLPSTVSVADIEQEFKTFGRIIPDGVFLRNRKDIGVCYAFVEFEDLQAVQNAIKASPIQLAGRQVYIEERRANSFGASRGGRRGRGRGSYQSEAPRGRFGARSFGRGGNQDGGDFNKSRGNGFRTYN
ncbi:Ras GTPase-activating protein-binding protein like [Actinidia chinensis var. chinensis]|uniref:Ras GTPase-activating protein-binding protein like n=1 Tax=Actinidia chinensis var. chinensis TaxID=1590841 RepID=A0A2R6P6Y6_ACTCC|nr:Ras GTPase-activating protein-binding protein like [Actinidia chinensis var. chinensis]